MSSSKSYDLHGYLTQLISSMVLYHYHTSKALACLTNRLITVNPTFGYTPQAPKPPHGEAASLEPTYPADLMTIAPSWAPEKPMLSVHLG